MPKIIDYNLKRQEIVQNALYVFIDKGYHKTRFSNIAKRCGMGRTTLYQYFKNKDEIFYYVVKKGIKAFKEEYENILNNEELNYIDKISELVSTVVNDKSRDGIMIIFIELWLILRREQNEIEDSLRVHIKELRHIFKSLLIKAKEEGEIKDVDAETMSLILYAMIESSALQRFWNSNIDLDKYILSIKTLINGLKKN
ncbi:TetR/AcrR family transcriptional regulator [Clostridiisalibacter paucivorans]|uniref:TetR/AcrR family transcriptional regulator n=1 Tax=Clostridiisalibacter paucivorans TaxID=408753 RepID=UPI00047D6660|nr:TetR/AcrR family transcriptional regulator [Clostridiisalibacter paucivorans]